MLDCIILKLKRNLENGTVTYYTRPSLRPGNSLLLHSLKNLVRIIITVLWLDVIIFAREMQKSLKIIFIDIKNILRRHDRAVRREVTIGYPTLLTIMLQAWRLTDYQWVKKAKLKPLYLIWSIIDHISLLSDFPQWRKLGNFVVYTFGASQQNSTRKNIL